MGFGFGRGLQTIDEKVDSNMFDLHLKSECCIRCAAIGSSLWPSDAQMLGKVWALKHGIRALIEFIRQALKKTSLQH